MKLVALLRPAVARAVEGIRAEGTGTVVHVLVALGGLGTWVFASVLVLRECVHSLDHAPGEPSAFARLFQDLSPFPGALAIPVPVTLCVVIWSAWRLRPAGEKEAPSIYRILPLSMAACFALFAAVAAALLVLDFAGRSTPHAMGQTLFGGALLRVVVLDSSLALAATIYHFWKLWPIPYLCAAGGAWAAWSVVLAGEVRSLLEVLPSSLPGIYPTVPVAAAETAVVAGAVFGSAAFARRSDTSRPFSELVFAGVAWFPLLHLAVTAGALAPYHHGMIILRPMGFQWAVTAAVALVFVAAWAIIIVLTLRASRKRQHPEGEAP